MRRSMATARSQTTMHSELRALIDAWRTTAAERMRTAKAYKCRSMDGERSGLIKGAVALLQAAQQVESILDADASQKPAP